MSLAKRRVRGKAGGGFVSAILLAAGLSTRFGATKQLERLGGEPLVRLALAALLGSHVDEVVVVVGHQARAVAREVIGANARVVFNENYRSGMGSSIKAGLAHLSPRSQAVLICLADQPLLTPRAADRIVARWRRTAADIVASSSGGVVSPPVLLSRRLYGELALIPDGTGARALIERHPGYERVDFAGQALLDVDTEGDMERARRAQRVTRARRSRVGGRPSRALPSR